MVCPLAPGGNYPARYGAPIKELLEADLCPLALMLNALTEQDANGGLELVRSFDGVPLIIDSPEPSVVLSGAMRARELGMAERTMCGGLSVAHPESFWEELQQADVRAAVLKAFNPNDDSLKGRIYALEDGGGVIGEGLIDRAKRYRITMAIIDTGGPGSGGSGLRALSVAKAKWGLPCGCDLTHEVEPNGPCSLGVAAAVSQAAGADVVFAGRQTGWEAVARAIALTDSLMSQATADM